MPIPATIVGKPVPGADRSGGTTPDGAGRAVAPISIRDSRLLSSPFLSDAERETLADAFLPPRIARPGRPLMTEVDGTDCIYLVVAGWACRFAVMTWGRRQWLGLALPGDIANLDFLMVRDLPYRVTTLGEAHVAPLPRRRAHELAAAYSGIGRTFAWLVALENVVLGRWITSMGRRSGKAQLAHLLCELAVRLNCPESNAAQFPSRLTQSQLGETLGMTSVHVNRLMQALRRDGLVETHDQIVTLPDVDRLRMLAEFDPAYLYRDSAGR